MTKTLALRGAVPPLCLLVVLAVLGACGRGHARAAAAASASAVSSAQVLEIGRRFSQCVREHGIPNFPDPVLNGQYLELPAGSNPDEGKVALQKNKAAQDACEPILNALPPSAVRARKPTSDQDMQQLLAFAQCMRQHGMPRWPDPDATGDFPLQAAGIEAKTPAVLAAMQACKQYNPGSIGVK